MKNGAAASPSDYQLDASVGNDLADWNSETTLIFSPLSAGDFEVTGAISWELVQQDITPAQLVVGEVPAAPAPSIAQDAFCELGGVLSVTSAVSTPYGLDTDLCASISDRTNSTPLTVPTVGCTSSGVNPNAVTNNFAVSSLSAGCYLLEFEASNRCGVTAVAREIDVFATPNFSLSLDPFCEGDPDAEVLSNFTATTTDCDGTPPGVSATWTLEGNSVTTSTPQALPLTESLLFQNGDIVCQSIELTYAVDEGETLQCANTSCVGIQFFEAEDIAYEVTQPASYPTICDGDDLEITVVAAPAISTHEWVTSPLPNQISSTSGFGASACTGNPSQSDNVASFFNLDAAGVSGVIRRTTCHFAVGIDPLQCITEKSINVEVATKPEISWADGVQNITACAYETSASLSIAIDNSDAAPSPLDVTWVVTTPASTFELVDQVSSADVLANTTLSLSLEDVILTCFGGNIDEVTNFDVQVSAVNDSGCESEFLEGSMTFYSAPQPTATLEAICEGECLEPTNVNASGGLEFQWFLDDTCDDMESIPAYDESGICPAPVPWDLSGTAIDAYSEENTPDFCDLSCNSVIGLRLRQSWSLPNVENGLLQCISSLGRFNPEVIPYPDLRVASESALCDNLEEFSFSAINCNDVNFTPDGLSCESCPVEACESCFSDITNILNWKYSIDGGETYAPQLFEPQLTGDNITISSEILTNGANPILIEVTSQTASANGSAKTCQSTESISFEWHEAPVIPGSGIEQPDFICPGVEYELDVVVSNYNGLYGELCFLWEECAPASTTSLLDIDGTPCTNDCDVQQGEGVAVSSKAYLTLPPDADPDADVCLDLTITDVVGCQVATSLTMDVRALPSVEGIRVLEAFDDAGGSSILLPPCAEPAANGSTPTACPGSEVFAGEETSMFCANSNFLIEARGAKGEFEENTPEGGVEYNLLNYQWEVLDASTPLGSNLVSLQDDCAFGSTPDLPCISSFDNAPSTTLSVYLTLSETDGCSAEFEWVDMVDVFPAPCIELTSNAEFCRNEDPELELCGPQSLAFCCDGNLEEPSANGSGCFEFVLPQACLATGSEAGPFFGTNTYAIADQTLACMSQEAVALVGINPPTSALVIEDSSLDATDGVACEGADFTMTVTASDAAPLSYEWIKDDNGTPASLGNGTSITLTAELDAGADCQVVNNANGVIIVSSTRPSGLVCRETTDWEVFIRPTPRFSLSPSTLDVCDGEIVELCATRTCGVEDGASPEQSWTWNTDPEFAETGASVSVDNPCWTFEAVYEGAPGDEISFNSKEISLTDSYGCLEETTFCTIHELPELEITASHACQGDGIDVEVTGADAYSFEFTPSTSVVTSDAIFAPGDAVTGDSIQQLQLIAPDSGDVLTVTGILAYSLVDGSVLECTSEDQVPSVVYPLPVIEPNWVLESPYCEADSVTFCDVNDDSDWVPPLYDFTPSVGDSEMETPEDCFTFELLPPSTTLTVTKILNYEFEGIVTTCETTLASIIDVLANPNIELTTETAICQEEDAAVSCDIVDPVDGSTYSLTWEVSGGGVLSGVEPGVAGTVNAASVESTTPETNGDPEDIVVGCEVVDEHGCSSTAAATIEVLATPILEWIVALPDSVCSPSQPCVEVGVTNDLTPLPQINVAWDNVLGPDNGCYLFERNAPCPNVQDIEVEVTLEHVLLAGGTRGCKSTLSDDLVVTPTPTPKFLLAAPQACFDTANAVCLDVLHDVEGYLLCEDDVHSYTWFVTPISGLSPNNVSIDDPNAPVPLVCMDAPGTVDVILEIENAYGCSQTTAAQPFTLRELPDPTLTFTQPDGICMPTTVVINATSIGASDFTMFIEDYGAFENFNSPLVLPVEYPGYRNVEFEVSKTHTTNSILDYDEDGNPITTDHVIVCAVDTTYIAAFEGVIPPVAAFSVLPDNTVDLADALIQFVNESEGQTENIWIFGDGGESGSSEVDPEHRYEATGEYTVELAVVNDRGCTDYAEEVIRVKDDLFMYVPNAFTPARGGEGGFADNLNDSWFPSIEGTKVIESYEVCVFNRTGHRVWCSQDPNHPSGEQWNGTGPEGTHLVPTGVYTWRISMKKKNGQGADVYTGHVSVIR
ncbi:MAG: PKD domain-containing protein [Bacteroidota bacterium]|nr:PKD domain-containing protein [Bacteroidota bacterium]